jgi:hypothetical protein
MDAAPKFRYRVRMNDRERFQRALERFDEENSRDPHQVIVNGEAHPRELLYARWLTEWVLRLSPDASETLRLAARSQHLCRWMIPRNSYEMTRAGYLRWRADLKQFHAGKSAGDPARDRVRGRCDPARPGFEFEKRARQGP